MKRLLAATFSASLAVGGFALTASAGDQEAGEISCLDASAKGDHEKAAMLCAKELEADPTNEKLKKALEVAKASIKKDSMKEGVAAAPASPAEN